MEEKEAIVYLQNGQRKCGKVIGLSDSGNINFIPNSVIDSMSTPPIEYINVSDIVEIDFCLK
jgi:hypothetical protein